MGSLRIGITLRLAWRNLWRNHRRTLIMLAAVIATVVAQIVERDSIYTYKLRRAGLRVGTGRDLTLLRKIPVTHVTPTPIPEEPIYPSDPLSKLVAMHAYHHVPDFAIVVC